MNYFRPVTKYSEIKSLSARRCVRHVLLSLSADYYKLSGKLASSLSKNRVQFLYFHHVFEDEQESFRKMLTSLNQSHSFISYSEAVERILNGRIDAPYLCVSFDDGFKNCLSAVKIMNGLGIKACFFLCTSIIGENSFDKIQRFCKERLYSAPIEFLSWDDIESIVAQGHEIGGHTVTHANLGNVSNQEIQDEIAVCYEDIRRKVGKIKHFSWPFGRFYHFSQFAAKVVFEVGFTSCASAERGCHISTGNTEESKLCIRRDHIVAGEPLKHALYFLERNSLVASVQNNHWPTELIGNF